MAEVTDSGATKFGARWETATTGAWLQRDTLAAPLDPSNANRYAFAGCDPINGSDPTGVSCGGAIFGAVTGVIGAISSIALIVASGGVGGPIGAIGFSVSLAGTVYSVGDAMNTCGD